jgi:signal transduction histidine kinase
MKKFSFGSDTYLIVLIVLCASVFSLIAVLTVNSTLIGMSQSSFLAVHIALEVFTIAVSLSIFGVRWFSGRISKDFPSTIIGATFLSVGLLDMFHMLSYPGMSTAIGDDPLQVSTYFWVFARFALIIGLLIAVYPTLEKRVNSGMFNRMFNQLILFAIVYAMFSFLLVSLYYDSLPSLNSVVEGPTTVGRIIEYVVIGLMIVGIIQYWRLHKRTGDLADLHIAGALIFLIFQELSFTIYAEQYDYINLMGHLFGFFGFIIIFASLIRTAVIAPFERLSMTRKQLESEHRKLGEALVRLEQTMKDERIAKSRTQTYFDFLAHDVSNMISPIMIYAEMLCQSESILKDPDNKEHAEKILTQVKQAGALINNLRQLADAESIIPHDFSMVDLTAALPELEEVLRRKHPDRIINITHTIDPKGLILLIGGEHIESIIFEIMDEAVKRNENNPVEIAVDINPISTNQDIVTWELKFGYFDRAHIAEIKDNVDILSDPEKRFRRRVASAFTFHSYILQHFGGRIIIDDTTEIPGKGFLVILELPGQTSK